MEPEEVTPPLPTVDEPLTPEEPQAQAEAQAPEEPQSAEESPEAEEFQAIEEPKDAEARQEEEEVSEEDPQPPPAELSNTELKAVLEAVIYITEEPLESKQIALALQQPLARVEAALAELMEEFSQPERGLQIREIAGGFKMSTKAEHHEAVRQFVKNLKPSFKLTSAALETLAVIAYKQPITAPEIMEIRGVQGAGVLKTLVDRKLITTAGRKNVVGKPILYKTTRDFLLQFGLKSVNELPTLKEFEELRRLAFSEDEMTEGPASISEASQQPAEAPTAEPAEEPRPEQENAAADPPPDTAAEA